WKQMSVW
uniref:WWamide-2 n=1 Tax=Lissachatina fulica TaxID=2315439 RepID=WWA2_LISFU|nr:RecName: Full=WWamide-2 [Lissachatina fulica]AAB26825.1 WWamide-3=neuromodulatory peptide [Achatina fulica=African giant snails, ganglia, Peptide, 7 aa] [Lissachatina fulica]